MRVLVTGAYGLIGAACLARLHAEGHELVAAGRSIEEASRRFPYARWVAADFNEFTHADDWLPLLTLANVDALVNCVGVLQDGARDDTRRVHVEATGALFDACVKAGVRRVVHISAIVAEADGASAFARTKAEADAHLRTLDLDWIVLRPALVLAPAAYGGTAMLRGLAGFPLATPVPEGTGPIQIVSVDDLTATIAFALGPRASGRVTWDLAHPQNHALGDIVAALRQWLGLPTGRTLRVPGFALDIVCALGDLAGRLGWRSPARSNAVAQLRAGIAGAPEAWIASTGIKPQSLADILAARSSGVQERWFARLFLLKPLLIGGLALFWIVSGLIALGPGWPAAIAILEGAGFSIGLARASALAAALLDVALGAALIRRAFARPALIAMLCVTALHLAMATILTPHLWGDPLGPLVKTLPLVLATLAALAILDER